jgi:hypothetical protein
VTVAAALRAVELRSIGPDDVRLLGDHRTGSGSRWGSSTTRSRASAGPEWRAANELVELLAREG